MTKLRLEFTIFKSNLISLLKKIYKKFQVSLLTFKCEIIELGTLSFKDTFDRIKLLRIITHNACRSLTELWTTFLVCLIKLYEIDRTFFVGREFFNCFAEIEEKLGKCGLNFVF